MSRRDDKPWLHPLTYGEAVLRCDWPRECGPRQLRGAVIAQMARTLSGRDLEPWTNRDGVTGEVLQSEPEILYRVHDAPSVFFVGPGTRDHLASLAYRLNELSLPTGERIGVQGITTRVYDGEVRMLAAGGWARYRFRTPYWPCDGVDRRRPAEGQGWTDAWASQAIAASLERWLSGRGIEPPAHRRVHVSVHGGTIRNLAWERPRRGVRVERRGFGCEFVANVLAPPGIGLGGKISEGLGEIDLVGVTGCR